MANIYRYLGVDPQFSGVAVYAISGGSTISTGDMCQWDTGSRIATSALLASGSIFLGVAESASPLAGLGTSSAPLTRNLVRIRSAGVHRFKSTTGETYSHMDAVYQGADAQTVSKVGATRMIGEVWYPDGTQVTGASGTEVNILVYGHGTLNRVLPSSTSTQL